MSGNIHLSVRSSERFDGSWCILTELRRRETAAESGESSVHEAPSFACKTVVIACRHPGDLQHLVQMRGDGIEQDTRAAAGAPSNLHSEHTDKSRFGVGRVSAIIEKHLKLKASASIDLCLWSLFVHA